MSSDPFALLGLDRKTATEPDIRKAYADRLKHTRPEDDREGFMALRAAFEHARQEARWRAEYPDEDDNEEALQDEETGAATQPSASGTASSQVLTESPSPETSAVEEGSDYDEEEDDYVPTDFDRRIDAAMQKLHQALTSAWGPPNPEDLNALLNPPDLEGIDEYRAMQWQVRHFICHTTGYYSQPQELFLPPWLTLQVFDTLDAQFGWTRQPSSHPAERHMNAWLRAARKKLDWLSIPYEARVKRERDRLLARRGVESSADKDYGSIVWLLAGAGILFSVVLRALTGIGS
ncbi:MAG: hypothetical protein ACK4M6_06575 [Hyphomonas sp.]